MITYSEFFFLFFELLSTSQLDLVVKAITLIKSIKEVRPTTYWLI
jgi:hypothetical protein